MSLCGGVSLCVAQCVAQLKEGRAISERHSSSMTGGNWGRQYYSLSVLSWVCRRSPRLVFSLSTAADTSTRHYVSVPCTNTSSLPSLSTHCPYPHTHPHHPFLISFLIL